ncbi:hypothetical protein VTN00DRAFT_3079 [Thermoascus crustaceus]|uniref:uncharacterized protein n=1 Tax=Thermoascus crustaceus TaxID=5088 RepID=UPI00374411FC
MDPQPPPDPDPARIDRDELVPPHTGDTILPNSPFFNRLVRYAHRQPPRLAIRDVTLGVEKTYLQLLTDALALRKTLNDTLSPAARKALKNGEDVYVALLAPGGYEYAVAFVAIVALGAAVVPMTVVLPVEEASYFILKANCVGILASSGAISLGTSLTTLVKKKSNTDIFCLPIAPSFRPSPLPASDILVSSSRALDDNAAGVVIFTSGTTGRPKGAVLRRHFVHSFGESIADHYRVGETDVILHVLPVHHATGIGINFVPFLNAGACVEFRSGSFDPAWTWERWKRTDKDGLTFFSGVPTIYMRMMRYYEQTLKRLPEAELREYVDGARRLRALLCGTSALPSPVQKFWTEVLGGRGILTRYGATEFGVGFSVPFERQGAGDVPEGSVGVPMPGVEVKLSEGDEGEVLIKSPHMFSHYLSDPPSTSHSHDPLGFFKSGDIARRVGPYYFITGRASLDIIKSGGYKISALDIEREILGLPYVAEVMVVGVADEEFGQRVAAAVTLREYQSEYVYATGGGRGEGEGKRRLTIEDLRRHLRSKLAGYKLPTLLRVVEGEFPKTASGKVLKKVLGPRYFHAVYRRDPGVQVWDRQEKSRL